MPLFCYRLGSLENGCLGRHNDSKLDLIVFGVLGAVPDIKRTDPMRLCILRVNSILADTGTVEACTAFK